MAQTICGEIVKSKRTLLALGWSIVNLLAFLSFTIALIYTLSTNYNRNNQQQYYNQEGEEVKNDMETSVTSRAMAFTALWTMVLSSLIGIYGTVVLGFISPTGKYYWCCSNRVHKTTPMIIGAFIGSLLMYANLTLVCSVLFGEFKVRDYNDQGGKEEDRRDENLSKSSTAFSIMCMFLTILYAGFSALVFTYSNDLILENEEDERREALRPSDDHEMRGYIGNKFTVKSPTSMSANNEQQAYIQPSESSDYNL